MDRCARPHLSERDKHISLRKRLVTDVLNRTQSPYLSERDDSERSAGLGRRRSICKRDVRARTSPSNTVERDRAEVWRAERARCEVSLSEMTALSERDKHISLINTFLTLSTELKARI